MRRQALVVCSAVCALIYGSVPAGATEASFSLGDPVVLDYAGSEGANAVAVDVNGDGLPDVVQAVDFGSPVVYLNNGSATPFAGVSGEVIDPAYTRQTGRVAVADVNHDGHPDIISTGFDSPTLVYINDGTSDPFAGVKGQAVGGAGARLANSLALAVGDVDGDGLPDLVVGNTNGEKNMLYLNDGTDDPFTAAGLPIGAETGFLADIALADVNGDHKLDVIVSDFANTGDAGVRIYLNDGTGTFTNVVPLFLRQDAGTGVIAVADLDGDHEPDLLVSGSIGHNWVYLNTGSRTAPFSSATELPGDPNIKSTCYGVTVADVDGDGHPDAVLGCGALLGGSSSGVEGAIYLNNGSADPFSGTVAIDLSPTTSQFSRSAQVVRLAKGGPLDLLLGINAPTYYPIIKAQAQTGGSGGGGALGWLPLLALLGSLFAHRKTLRERA